MQKQIWYVKIIFYRYLISCPKEVIFTSNMYKIPVPENLRSSMDKILKVISEKHETETVYRFDKEAKSVFNNQHDNYNIEKKMQFTEDENRRGVLSKSLGYIIRLSGIITAIQNASAVVKGMIYMLSIWLFFQQEVK